MPDIGMVRLHVRRDGKWHLYENFDPTSKEFAEAADTYDAAALAARQLGERLIAGGEAEAFAVLPAPRQTDSPGAADIPFLGVIARETAADHGGPGRSAPVREHQR